MPHHEISIDDVLGSAKERKHHKKSCCPPKKDDCNVNCCVPDCNPDCCTPAFQRLDKLRVNWQEVQLAVNDDLATSGIPTSVFTRGGSQVEVPVQTAETPNGEGVYLGNNELAAFAFVNQVRYLNYEECGKADQVLGWSVDLQTGELYFYQNLPDLGLTGLAYPGSGTTTTGDDRAFLLNTPPSSLTPYDRRKLQEMEPFWKLSLKAVERVRENPKTEGNICEIKDKCGNRFLVAINRAVGQNGYPTGNAYTGADQGASVCDYNSRYSIVAVKLC
jgi:hypothetical protein